MDLRDHLKKNGPVEASAPCRIDMGGTLDLSTFFLPLRHLRPCTFNAALDLRTHVRLSDHTPGKIKVSSVGFDSVEVDSHSAPFDHKLGLMLAVAAYYQADGVHIDIQSHSPPRSALGGSSVAASALIWAFSKAFQKAQGQAMPEPGAVAMLAHGIEQSVVGVPCGMQDQLAAVYGGVNAWHWISHPPDVPYERQQVIAEEDCKTFEQHLLIAYCGAPHVSADVNSTWVRQFVSGRYRRQWHKIAEFSRTFVGAVAKKDYSLARTVMNQETDIRCELTPQVLDEVGGQLVAAARDHECGARFTGAGGGGCIWALGELDDLAALRSVWENILTQREAAKILKTGIDAVGLL